MSMQIGDELLRRLVGRMDMRHTDIWLIDLRQPQAALFGVFVRAWAKNGILIRDITGTLGDTLPPLAERLLATDAAAVILAKAPEPILRQLSEANLQLVETLWESLPKPPALIMCNSDGDPIEGIEDFGNESGQHSLMIATAELTVTGVRRFELTGVHFPVRQIINMPSSEDPDGCAIMIEGSCVDPLPPKARFALSGPDQAVLIIDCVPDFNGRDHWLVTVEGWDAAPPRRAQRLSPNPDLPPMKRLIVIFDRTCPDEGSWSAARALMFGGAPEEADLMTTAADPAINPRDINVTVRHALGQALAEALDQGVTIEAYWFADVPGEGLSAPPGVETSAVGFGQVGQAPVSDAASLFADLTYFPGLDIWDALDDALAVALENGRPQERTALLIVGNSPPHLPTRANSPLCRIQKRLGYSTAFRRWAESWHENLHRCWKKRMPTGYLFLTHQRHGALESREFDVFRSMQTEVARALEDCGLDLERAPATKDGLERGAHLLLKRLNAADPRSRVELVSDCVP